jgi:hypothetical protein
MFRHTVAREFEWLVQEAGRIPCDVPEATALREGVVVTPKAGWEWYEGFDDQVRHPADIHIYDLICEQLSQALTFALATIMAESYMLNTRKT